MNWSFWERLLRNAKWIYKEMRLPASGAEVVKRELEGKGELRYTGIGDAGGVANLPIWTHKDEMHVWEEFPEETGRE